MRALAGVAVVLVALTAGGCSVFGGSSSADSYLVPDCKRADLHGHSVARVWDEALLDAIRRDTPAPTVHARNLFHTSAAMWDAWAAYDPDAEGYFVKEKLQADDVQEAREAAMSYAAYRLLLHRYSVAAGLQETFDELTRTMQSLCYDIDFVSTEGDSPAAFGNRIAAKVIAYGRTDGAHEPIRYAPVGFVPVNPPLVVAEPGTTMTDPNRWQPLALAQNVAQNGLTIPGKVQSIVGPFWGHVRGFALPASTAGTPIDPGPPPEVGDSGSDAAFKQEALDNILASSRLDPSDGVMIDIGPGAFGANPLGTNDGHGHDLNPATGSPYAPDRVLRADFARAIAEFWADGPESETPPGHWNTIANTVSDELVFPRQIGGAGPDVDRLEWDVKLYFALNGAVHDAAVAAWGLKGAYESARPISMIRYMGGKGQSSDPDGPSYDPDGLPLVPGLVEVVTRASSAPGERHAKLSGHIGEVAIRAWRGNLEDPATESGGVSWILAVDWVPYQRPTFVTPAFPGYVSGHSTFSRAAAEVLTKFTASSYFPNGLLEWKIPAGSLSFESGPTQDVTLEWATYYDAADQAGMSRVYGGIHPTVDDFTGRIVGSKCGNGAWALAEKYFEGTA
jgi:hypothetical protein